MPLKNVIENIVLFLQIVAALLLLAGAVALAFYGIPLLLIFLSRYISEVTLGLWIGIGGIVLGVLTLLYILLKKH